VLGVYTPTVLPHVCSAFGEYAMAAFGCVLAAAMLVPAMRVVGRCGVADSRKGVARRLDLAHFRP
jgi:hypothetical protein